MAAIYILQFRARLRLSCKMTQAYKLPESNKCPVCILLSYISSCDAKETEICKQPASRHVQTSRCGRGVSNFPSYSIPAIKQIIQAEVLCGFPQILQGNVGIVP
jgi:hypothetical protein